MAGPQSGLARGTEVRSRRATMKRGMREGSIDPLELLAGRDERWEEVAIEMPIAQLLRAMPGVGEQTAEKVLAERSIPGSTRLFGLTLERRREIAAGLKEVVDR